MKNLLKVMFVIAFAIVANNAFAQKFAHINRNELIQAMPEVKTAQEKLETYYRELLAQLEEMQVESNKKLDDFQKNSESWTEEKRELKSQEIVSFRQRVQEQQQVAEEKLKTKE
ncbi:MAG: OmpH family outer membrane protein, partial [Prevotellaceae bacterium]|nr:OmpH family outer membrane protein [Prevotellaceae bacterium]